MGSQSGRLRVHSNVGVCRFAEAHARWCSCTCTHPHWMKCVYMAVRESDTLCKRVWPPWTDRVIATARYRLTSSNKYDYNCYYNSVLWFHNRMRVSRLFLIYWNIYHHGWSKNAQTFWLKCFFKTEFLEVTILSEIPGIAWML